MVAGVLYIAVTVLFYFIFKPVSRAISLVAAIISLAGIAIGPLSFALKPLAAISPLMAFAGLGWLTFLSPSFALSLSPYIFLPGIIGKVR